MPTATFCYQILVATQNYKDRCGCGDDSYQETNEKSKNIANDGNAEY
jgi:hypothetical protein